MLLAVKLLSIVTGAIFTITITRELAAQEYGMWGVIANLLVFGIVINSIVGYWVTREKARGEDSGRTAVLFSGAFSAVGVCLYLAAAFLVGARSDADTGVLFLSAMLVPALFLNETFTAINLGKRPHVISYGFLAFELLQISAVLVLVYHLQAGIGGAIISTLVAYAGSAAVLGAYARGDVRARLQKRYVTKWLRLFWLPSYRGLPMVLASTDVIVFSVVTGSVVGVAYFTAARAVGFLVNNTSWFSKGLYPKLLETGRQEFFSANLIRFFYFAFPITACSIAFAKPALFALNPMYGGAQLVAVVFSVQSFLAALNLVLFEALQGVESVDLDKKAGFRDYVRSRLTWFPTYQLLRHGVYISVLAAVLYALASDSTELELVLYWVMIGLAVEVPFAAYVVRRVREDFVFGIDWASFAKYLLAAAAAFGAAYVVMEEYLAYEQGIFEFLPPVIGYLALAVGAYLGVTWVVDQKTRRLFGLVLCEVGGRIRGKK